MDSEIICFHFGIYQSPFSSFRFKDVILVKLKSGVTYKFHRGICNKLIVVVNARIVVNTFMQELGSISESQH